MNVIENIKFVVSSDPHREALVFNNARLSYEELDKKSNQLAGVLIQKGIQKGMRIGILMPNCVENIVSFIAILKIGCIEVNTSPRMHYTYILNIFRETNISVLFCAYVKPMLLSKLIKELPGLRLIIGPEKPVYSLPAINNTSFEDVWKEPQNFEPFSLTGSERAMIQYTSGTTRYGRPKGAVLTQNNFLQASLSRNEILCMDKNAKILNVLPLFHSCSKSLLFDSLWLGATLVLSEGFKSPHYLVKKMIGEQITIVTGPPLLFHYLVKTKSRQDILGRLKNIRFLEIGMAGAPKQLFYDLRKTFSWATIINRYGLTENAGAAALNCITPGDDFSKIGSCGKAVSSMSIEIRDRNNNLCAPGETGTILIKGKNIMTGYWGDIQSGTFYDYINNGFLTDDIGKMDEQGFVYILGRKDEIIKIAGEKVYPLEIEQCIKQICGVDEAAVFPVECNILGNKIIAVFVSSKHGIEKEILEFCRAHLPAYMVPDELIRYTMPLPKTESGKIAKFMLKEKYTVQAE